VAGKLWWGEAPALPKFFREEEQLTQSVSCFAEKIAEPVTQRVAGMLEIDTKIYAIVKSGGVRQERIRPARQLFGAAYAGSGLVGFLGRAIGRSGASPHHFCVPSSSQ
jgi:hypothetical protein